MQQIHLIHWNPAEAEVKAASLRILGYEVNTRTPDGPQFFRQLRSAPPAAMLIDLTRLPSQGRDLGVNLRAFSSTRQVTLIFIGGEPGKTARIQRILPDAVYTTWEELPAVLAEALAHPLPEPQPVDSVFAAYAHAPLSQKLGLQPGMRLLALNAPEGLPALVGDLPAGAEWNSDPAAPCGLVLWFVRSPAELESNLPGLAERCAGGARLWIFWPKQKAAVTGLTQSLVRQHGLAARLVDYKICSLDAYWSGLLFTSRKEAR